MSREVAEWIATYDDQAIPARVKVRVFERCEGKCAKTGVKVRPGHFQYDHIIELINGGEHRESNLQLLSTEAHREKTNAALKVKSKIARIRKKSLGLWPAPIRKIASRPFPTRGNAQ